MSIRYRLILYRQDSGFKVKLDKGSVLESTTGDPSDLPILLTRTLWVQNLVHCSLGIIIKFILNKEKLSLQVTSASTSSTPVISNGLGLCYYYGCCSVAKLCLTLCNPMNCGTPSFPVLHHLPEFAQTHVHWAHDVIQPSHPLSSPTPLAFNLSQL